jgi:hydroxymethylpyrimidine pyrophosphatase-like HAD family hydrolase
MTHGLVGGRSPAAHALLARGPDLLVADVDGTLVARGDEGPSRVIVSAVREVERAGAVVVVCTGRPTERALQTARDLGLRLGFVISYGGAETRDLADNGIVAQVALSEDARAVVGAIAASLGVELSTYESSAGTLRLVLTGQVPRVERAVLAVDESLGRAVRLSRPSSQVVAVHDAAATKLGALVALSRMLELDPAAVAYLGDADDDAPALAWAGLGVAVAGGSRAAEAAADIVTRPQELPELLTRFALARRLRAAG